MRWTDRSAPQIAGLIDGASGKTLLVQVHRERKSAQLDRPFIDPALAVWRVGEPAPREYEELYLNENWNKGFVIVDPDTIESGAPFVFNSGFVEIVEQVVSRVADDDNWRQIKETLIQNVGTATIPVIKVEDCDYLNNRTLLLKHSHDGRDLQLEYAEKTLKYVQQLWGHDVVMETLIDGRGTLLTFSDGKFIIKKAA